MTRTKAEQEPNRRRKQLHSLGLVEYKQAKRARCGHMTYVFDRKTWVCMACALRKRKAAKE